MATVTLEAKLNAAELVATHQAGVWRYLRYLGCDDSQADDLTQETFLAVIRKPFEQHTAAATAAYLRTVARNLLLMAVRRQGRRPTVENLDLADEVWARHYGDDGGDTYREALTDCLERFDGEGRARYALDLRYREGRSRSEMAAALAMSEEGVKSLLRRARDILRACVEKKTRSD